jgi:hypothetical protein
VPQELDLARTGFGASVVSAAISETADVRDDTVAEPHPVDLRILHAEVG